MTAVVFETPGLIDVRAFTIMGAHAKPNSINPIGYFGTGLKYAIAVLVRLGAEPVVWIGRDRFSFATYATTFRGLPLETIKMRVLKDGQKRPSYYEMPYTTQYGKNWKAWQAFRELESNTRDEGGRTMLVDGPVVYYGASESTRIIVDNAEFLEAAEKIDSIFLPRAKRSGTLLEAIDANDRLDAEDANWVYYRTMRALDVGKPTLYTYNFLESLTLTEDRTLAYGFQVRDVLARWVLTEATEAQVESIVTADKEWWEADLAYPGHIRPSDAFRAVMARRPKGISSYAFGYWSSYSGGYIRAPKRTFSLFQTAPKPWKLSGDFVFDANQNAVFERPDDMDSDDWDNIAIAIIIKLDAGNGLTDEAPEPEPAEPADEADTAPAIEETAPCLLAPESGEGQGEDQISF